MAVISAGESSRLFELFNTWLRDGILWADEPTQWTLNVVMFYGQHIDTMFQFGDCNRHRCHSDGCDKFFENSFSIKFFFIWNAFSSLRNHQISQIINKQRSKVCSNDSASFRCLSFTIYGFNGAKKVQLNRLCIWNACQGTNAYNNECTVHVT